MSVSFFDTKFLRVSNQNGISRLYIIVEIYHSGRKPSFCFWFKILKTVLCMLENVHELVTRDVMVEVV